MTTEKSSAYYIYNRFYTGMQLNTVCSINGNTHLKADTHLNYCDDLGENDMPGFYVHKTVHICHDYLCLKKIISSCDLFYLLLNYALILF